MTILFHNTMKVTEGHLDPFKEALRQAVDFVREHGPQLMVQVFIDEDRGVAHSFQLYPDSQAVLDHWVLSDPYIDAVMAHCTVESFENYGQMSEEVLTGLRDSVGDPGSTRPLLTGFTRF